MEEKRRRFYLPCADDEGKPTCYICGDGVSFPSMKALYHHMLRHLDSHWFEVLPPEPMNSTVIVCRTLLPTVDPLDDEDLKCNGDVSLSNEGEIVDLVKLLPPWKTVVTGSTGRPAVKRRRGFPACR